MCRIVLCSLAVICSVASSPLYTADVDQEISDLDLLIPIIVDGDKPFAKKSFGHDAKMREPVDVDLRDTAFSDIPASAFRPDDSKRSQKTRPAGAQKESSKGKVVNSEAREIDAGNVAELKIKFVLIQKCLNNVDDKFGGGPKTAEFLEMALHLCKVLADTFMDPGTDEGPLGHRAKDKGRGIVQAKASEKSKHASEAKRHVEDECSNCCHVFFYTEVDEDDGEDLETVVRERLAAVRSALAGRAGWPGPGRQAPVGWPAPPAGRRDWMMLDHKQPSMLKSYLDRGDRFQHLHDSNSDLKKILFQ